MSDAVRRRNPPSLRLARELELVRGELAAAVARSSLRAVAREVHMSATGLQGVLDGSHPYGKTWDKLRVWYARGDTHERELPPSMIDGLLRRLMRGIPDRHWPEAQSRLLVAVEGIHREFRQKAPGWVRELRRCAAAEAAGKARP